MAFASSRSGNCRLFLCVRIFKRLRRFQKNRFSDFSTTCQKIVRFPFLILRPGGTKRRFSCAERVSAISSIECATALLLLGTSSHLQAFLTHFPRVHWFGIPQPRLNRSLFHRFRIINYMSTSMERHNRVIGNERRSQFGSPGSLTICLRPTGFNTTRPSFEAPCFGVLRLDGALDTAD